MTVISFDLNHPAHYLAFRDVLSRNEILGFEPLIFIQEKGTLKDLLLQNNFNFAIKKNKQTIFSRASLLLRDIMFVRKIMKQQGIACNFGKCPIVGSWSAKSLNRRSIVIDDTDTPIGQIHFCRWVADEIWTPNCYSRNLGKKHHKFNGIFPLSYLDPKIFQPDKSIPQSLGLLERGKPILIRIVDYNALHDWKKRNKRDNFLDIIKILEKDYEIVLSIEGENYPRELDKYTMKFDPWNYHHILAFSQLYIGSGASTAAEAGILGIPSIYTNYQKPGFIKWLETQYGMIKSVPNELLSLDMIENILTIDKKKWIEIKNQIFKDCIDVPKLIENLIKREVMLDLNK